MSIDQAWWSQDTEDRCVPSDEACQVVQATPGRWYVTIMRTEICVQVVKKDLLWAIGSYGGDWLLVDDGEGQYRAEYLEG